MATQCISMSKQLKKIKMLITIDCEGSSNGSAYSQPSSEPHCGIYLTMPWVRRERRRVVCKLRMLAANGGSLSPLPTLHMKKLRLRKVKWLAQLRAAVYHCFSSFNPATSSAQCLLHMNSICSIPDIFYLSNLKSDL